MSLIELYWVCYGSFIAQEWIIPAIVCAVEYKDCALKAADDLLQQNICLTSLRTRQPQGKWKKIEKERENESAKSRKYRATEMLIEFIEMQSIILWVFLQQI